MSELERLRNHVAAAEHHIAVKEAEVKRLEAENDSLRSTIAALRRVIHEDANRFRVVAGGGLVVDL